MRWSERFEIVTGADVCIVLSRVFLMTANPNSGVVSGKVRETSECLKSDKSSRKQGNEFNALNQKKKK